MNRQLVFIHGRAQENKDSLALKAEWIADLKTGLEKSNLTLPIAETDIHFPFYGDVLYNLVAGKSAADAGEIIVRGAQDDTRERVFIKAVLDEVLKENNIEDDDLVAIAGSDFIERGPLNNKWVLAVLRAIDARIPGGSGFAIALATHDVFKYLYDSNIRKIIENGVRATLNSTRETVVVSHSLGTVVAYTLLLRDGTQAGWKVPQFVTLGSPLAVTAIRAALKATVAPAQCPQCVGKWFNARDDLDVVALYSLTKDHFPLSPETPSIENKIDIKNGTPNHHGISGYLGDRDVAKRIYDALTA